MIVISPSLFTAGSGLAGTLNRRARHAAQRSAGATAPRGAFLTPADRAALGVWAGSRAGLVLLVAWALPLAGMLAQFLDRWQRWDTDFFLQIARHGYGGDPAGPHHRHPSGPSDLMAFFPGFPFAVRAAHLLVPDWRAAALLVSLVAGAVAAVALSRLGELDGPPGTGPRAVLALVLSPFAVFLFAGYSEALFLAFALPAWLLARRCRWPAAALCAAGASWVRITGLFLGVALVVAFVTAGRPVPWRRAPWLLVPFVPLAGYAAYLWRRTGDVLAWPHAEAHWSSRRPTWPWDAFVNTVQRVTGDWFYVPAMRVELLAAVTGAALTAWLLAHRRWGEATYVGLQLAALGTSAYYVAVGRAALLWWPLWLALGAAGVRRPWVFAGYALAAAPLMARFALMFTAGQWAG